MIMHNLKEFFTIEIDYFAFYTDTFFAFI